MQVLSQMSGMGELLQNDATDVTGRNYSAARFPPSFFRTNGRTNAEGGL